MSTPGNVNAAFWIAIIVPVLSLVLVVLNFVLTYGWQQEMLASVQEQMERSGLGDSEQLSDQIGTGSTVAGFVVTMVVYLMLTGLWVLFGFKMRAGRNWARITLIVFASIWILASIVNLIVGGLGTASFVGSAVAGVDMSPPLGALVVTYIQWGMSLVTMTAFIPLVLLRQSNWYFKAPAFR